MQDTNDLVSTEKTKLNFNSKDFALNIAKLAIEKKAKEIVILNVKDLVDYTDYFVICSENNDRAVRAIAEHSIESMKKHGVVPLGEEGLKYGQWVLIDFGDVVFHIFYKPLRDFYGLEKLWADAEQIEIPETKEEYQKNEE